MASSTALTLVNKVLRLTGDYKAVSTISGSPANIAERIIDFMNLVLGDIENKANWPILRVNATGTGDGTNDIFDFTGSEDVRTGGAVSVWIAGQDRLDELTPEQFDRALTEGISGQPLYFQRGVSSTGKLQVQILPTPANGDVINMTAYAKATRLDAANDSSTTEFDDDLLVYGALMHMDLFDQIDRGYAALYKYKLNDAMSEFFRNAQFQIEVESYT